MYDEYLEFFLLRIRADIVTGKMRFEMSTTYKCSCDGFFLNYNLSVICYAQIRGVHEFAYCIIFYLRVHILRVSVNSHPI